MQPTGPAAAQTTFVNWGRPRRQARDRFCAHNQDPARTSARSTGATTALAFAWPSSPGDVCVAPRAIWPKLMTARLRTQRTMPQVFDVANQQFLVSTHLHLLNSTCSYPSLRSLLLGETLVLAVAGGKGHHHGRARRNHRCGQEVPYGRRGTGHCGWLGSGPSRPEGAIPEIAPVGITETVPAVVAVTTKRRCRGHRSKGNGPRLGLWPSRTGERRSGHHQVRCGRGRRCLPL